MSEGREAPAETRRAIMEATYRAIGRTGYADLTMAAIAAEFEKSQSLIHYHFDTKEELLVAFLEYLIEQFEEKVADGTSQAPRETLEAVVDALLVGPPDRENFQAAMLELRAQTPYEPAFREQFAANDEHLRAVIADLIDDCLDEGASADPDALARRLLIAIEGARTRRVVLADDAEVAAGRAVIDDLLEDALGAPR